MSSKSRYLKGRLIASKPIRKGAGIVELVGSYFQDYDAGRLREACQLLVQKYLQSDVTVGMTITGALTPAGPRRRESHFAKPILTSYTLAKHKRRKLKRLIDRRIDNLERLKKEYFRAKDKRKYAT